MHSGTFPYQLFIDLDENKNKQKPILNWMFPNCHLLVSSRNGTPGKMVLQEDLDSNRNSEGHLQTAMF